MSTALRQHGKLMWKVNSFWLCRTEPLSRRLCFEVESTSMTMIQRRNNDVCEWEVVSAERSLGCDMVLASRVRELRAAGF